MTIVQQTLQQTRRGVRPWRRTSLVALFHEWRRRFHDRCALANLCDRSLRDIGLTRYDADREARKPFWRA
jgi:uncharacterized protein YjiS (DUF1127 family)